MNKGNFTAKSSFPPSTYMLDFLQNQSFMAGNMAQLGGQNYILSGCTETGTSVSAGLIVINGEILPFEAGTKKEKITIQETMVNEHAFGVDYPEAYIYRTAKFSDTGEYNWSDFVQVLTNRQLQQRIEQIKGDAPGTVKMWAGQIVKIPDDYKLCNGDILSKNDYPDLFENLGTAFGGDGINSFALPDLRGRFIAGYDSTKQDYNTISKIGGSEKVALTVNQIPEHNHVNNSVYNKLSARAADAASPGTTTSLDTGSAETEYNIGRMNPDEWTSAEIQKVGNGEAHENRPPYFVLAYIIKVK